MLFIKADCTKLNQFYKQHKDKARAKPSDIMYIASENDSIYAVLRLLPYNNFLFLRSVLTAPEARGKGIASKLITHAVKQQSLTIYTLPTPSALNLYYRLGFEPVDQKNIPIELTSSYRRFRQASKGPTVMVINN